MPVSEWPPPALPHTHPQQSIANRECKVLNIHLDDLREVRAARGLV